MAGEIITTVVGNLTGDPEIRFTTQGTPVATFSVANNPRKFTNGQWTDGEPSYVRVSAFGQLGENIATSLTRGMRVIVQGTFSERHWQDREGNDRSAWGLTANAVGAELTFHSAVVRRATRSGGRSTQKDESDPWESFSSEPPNTNESTDSPGGIDEFKPSDDTQTDDVPKTRTRTRKSQS